MYENVLCPPKNTHTPGRGMKGQVFLPQIAGTKAAGECLMAAGGNGMRDDETLPFGGVSTEQTT